MRWPWASHDTLVDLIKVFGDQQAKWAAQQEAKYDALLDKYHALKLQGAAPSIESLPVRQPKSTDEADEEAAMDEAVSPVPVFHDDD